ncbi:uncharacterized protein EV422DRAFT_532735 [Fimicolochytrium jonesii]|uniref:uncharacterized protein n=1 Tax=Fimicolochytrium jonesii TaxID=1396493 RepID=UPI0022FEE5F5|nr:uncharacterized protein EV422DRAFT_532735 [Fimicolochytrium jonesii]KAI8819912.1 hypothetical protein EV422DRAFT_532735 [Fimicolochytrium jonesii]
MTSANFRKAYYSSLGVQVVEVKPSLETALQGDILNIERLNKLCLWVRIPHSYRALVWKVLLGTVSLTKEVWGFADAQRAEQYGDLRRCVQCMDGGSRADEELTPSTMVRMLLIQLDTDDQVPHHLSGSLDRSKSSHLLALANTILEICEENEEEAYWLFEYFVRKYRVPLVVHDRTSADSGVREKPDGHDISTSPDSDADPPPSPIAKLEEDRISMEIGALSTLLKTHNEELLTHILSLGRPLSTYCYAWFRTYFASVVPPHCLEGVWDILIGGAPGILPYLGLSVFLASKRKILAVRTSAQLVELLSQVENIVDMDAVANTAIDMWERPVLEGMSKELRKALGYNF